MANVISLPIKLSSGAKYEHGTRRKFDKLFFTNFVVEPIVTIGSTTKLAKIVNKDSL